MNTLIFIQRKCITYSKNGHSDIYRTLASSLSGLRTQRGYGGGEKTICQIALPLHPSPDSLLEIAVHLKRKHLNKQNESCGCPVSLTLPSHRHFLQGRQKDSFVKFDILNVPLLQECLHFKKKINIRGVSTNRSLPGFSWPEGTLFEFSLGRDQGVSENRDSKPTVLYLATLRGL